MVRYRRVTVGQQELEGLSGIEEGLAEGDRVIVSGMQRVRSGTQSRDQDAAAAQSTRVAVGAVVERKIVSGEWVNGEWWCLAAGRKARGPPALPLNENLLRLITHHGYRGR